MDRARVDEDSGGWTITFAGALVTQIRVDYAFSLLLEDGSMVRIESPFDLVTADVTTRLPLGDSFEVAPALALLHRVVDQARVERSGTLRMAFEDGWAIDVPPDARYENWQITTPDRGMWVGLPGGDVSVFPPA